MRTHNSAGHAVAFHHNRCGKAGLTGKPGLATGNPPTDMDKGHMADCPWDRRRWTTWETGMLGDGQGHAKWWTCPPPPNLQTEKCGWGSSIREALVSTGRVDGGCLLIKEDAHCQAQARPPPHGLSFPTSLGSDGFADIRVAAWARGGPMNSQWPAPVIVPPCRLAEKKPLFPLPPASTVCCSSHGDAVLGHLACGFHSLRCLDVCRAQQILKTKKKDDKISQK